MKIVKDEKCSSTTRSNPSSSVRKSVRRRKKARPRQFI